MYDLSVQADITENIAGLTREAIFEFLRDGAEAGQAVALERVPQDDGDLLKNMAQFQPEAREGRVVWGVSDVPYALAIDQGTQPFTPPLRPLLEWADRTFSTERNADEVLQDLDENGWHPGIFNHPGAAVWSKIRSEGITANPYLTPGAEAQADWYKSHDPSEYIEDNLE